MRKRLGTDLNVVNRLLELLQTFDKAEFLLESVKAIVSVNKKQPPTVLTALNAHKERINAKLKAKSEKATAKEAE